MTDSPSRGHAQPSERKEDKEQRTQHRICDFCGESLALLYCRADSAKLCLSCDRQVHSTNQLFTKHTRWQLCDTCHHSPASILCSTHNLLLCQNCDWESHSHSSSPSSLHDRRPLEGFTGCPSVTELLAIVGFEDLGKKALFEGDGIDGSMDVGNGCADLLLWDTPSFVSLDDLIVSADSAQSFQAIGVPPPPKNRKATAGKCEREMLHQLRELSKLEPGCNDGLGDDEPLVGFQCLFSEEKLHTGNMCAGSGDGEDPAAIPSYEANAFQLCSDNGDVANQDLYSTVIGSYLEENLLVPEKDSDIGGSARHEGQWNHHMYSETLKISPKVAARELTSQERDSAITRYKEKKKTRRYDKHIRYESRKVRAESRTRVKGRFAKMDH